MQGSLKGMVLSALKTGEKTSNSIFIEVSNNEYEFDIPGVGSQKFKYAGNVNNIRAELLYLRKHKFIKIVNKEIPYIYGITSLGKKGAVEPFKYLEYRQKVIDKGIEKELKSSTAELEKENKVTQQKALKSRTAELEAEFEDRVNGEAEKRIEAEIQRVHASNKDIIAQRAKEIAHSVLYDGREEFRDAVKAKAKELMTQEYIPRGTKLFVGLNNMVELNISNNSENPHPLVIVVEKGKIIQSYQKE